MANDVPDWTGQQRVNIRGEVSGAPLGDVGAPTLIPDSVSETLSWGGGTVIGNAAVLASFKPAAGSVIAQVGALGAFTRAAGSPITPPFAQPTVAGHLLLAWVSSLNNEATTVAAGWVRVVSRHDLAGNTWAGLWAKLNCGAAEAAPQFTAPGGSGNLYAQLGEFSGVALAAATDVTASVTTASNPVAVTAGAPDAGFGDLVAQASSWWMNFPQTVAGFAATVNNLAALVHAGDSGAGTPTVQHASFNYAIVPAATMVLPLGTQPWPVDVTATTLPATGSNATATLAANPSKAYTIHTYSGELAQTATTADVETLNLQHGATPFASHRLAVPSGAGTSRDLGRVGVAHKGAINEAISLGFSSATAGVAQSVSIGAYLR